MDQKRQMSANIPAEWHERRAELGLPWVVIIRRGLEAIENRGDIAEQIAELERRNDNFSRQITKVWGNIETLRIRTNKIENCPGIAEHIEKDNDTEAK